MHTNLSDGFRWVNPMITSSNGNIFRVTGHLSLVTSPHKGQWHGALVFSLICVWINDRVNNLKAGDLSRYRAHYDVIVMRYSGWRDNRSWAFSRHLPQWFTNAYLSPECLSLQCNPELCEYILGKQISRSMQQTANDIHNSWNALQHLRYISHGALPLLDILYLFCMNMTYIAV